MIKILEKDNEKIKIEVSNINPAIAAMIRRAIIAEIPTLAIETVKIIKNDSVLRDEILANRLGLIPLTFDKNKVKKGKYNVKLFIKKKGGGYVYTKDMISENSEVVPMYDNIPITYLNENDELEIECETEVGFGKMHAKWQAGNCGYYYSNDKFVFNIETTSFYKPEELFSEALDVIIKKLEDLEKSI